jgi:hypothetical protein
MARLMATILLAIMMFGPGVAGLARAQTPQPQPPAPAGPALPDLLLPDLLLPDLPLHDLPPEERRDLMVLHFTAQYTNTVLIGLVTGGVVGNLAFGGLPATAIGAILGASAGSLWFFHRFAAEYQAIRKGENRPLEFPGSPLP